MAIWIQYVIKLVYLNTLNVQLKAAAKLFILHLIDHIEPNTDTLHINSHTHR